MGPWAWYLRQLGRRPLLTQATTTGVLFVVGDTIAQQAIERRGFQRHDFERSARMGAVGLVFVGPVLRGWYVFLDKVVRFRHPGAAALTKMVLDQSICAPAFLYSFFCILSTLEGKSKQDTMKRIDQDYVPTLIANYKLWPATQIINFYFVPLQHRLLVVNTVALAWNSYLAYVANSEIRKPSASS